MSNRLEDLEWQLKFYKSVVDHARDKRLYWRLTNRVAGIMIEIREIQRAEKV